MCDNVVNDRRRAVLGWVILTLVCAGVGLGLALVSPEMPGSEPMTLEDGVDAVAMLSFGILGAALVRRRVAVGLGVALALVAVLSALSYLLSGLAQANANGEPGPPPIAQVCSLAADGAFIITFFLFILAPMLLFPTGRLPSRRWRWPAGAAVVGCVISVLAVLLTPGPVDEDNPAWGVNPIGLDGLSGVTDALELIGVALLLLGLLTGLAAFGMRWVRYRGRPRRQLAWFSLAIVLIVVGLVTDVGGSVVVEVTMALAIFGAMFIGIGWPLLGPLGRIADDTEDTDVPNAPDAPNPASRPSMPAEAG